MKSSPSHPSSRRDTAGSRPAPIQHPAMSIGFHPRGATLANRASTTSRRFSRSTRASSIPIVAASKRATISRRPNSTSNASPKPHAAIGGSRACTGTLIASSAMIYPAIEPAMAPRIWPSFAVLLSASYAPTKIAEASRHAVKKPAGIPIFCSKCSSSNSVNLDSVPWFSTSCPSIHRHAAVYVHRVPGHISSLIGGKINRRSSDIAARTQSAGGNPSKDRLTLLLIEFVCHWARNKPRRDAIRRHATFGIFLRYRFDHTDYAGLGCCIVALAGGAGDAHHRCDGDDPAMTTPHHSFDGRTREAKGSGQVDRNHLIPYRVAQLNEEVVPRDPRIGDEDIKLAHLSLALRYQGLDFFLFSQVTGRHMNTSTQFPSKPLKCILSRS